MVPQHEARVAEDDEDEVNADGPEGADDEEAANAFGLQERVA